MSSGILAANLHIVGTDNTVANTASVEFLSGSTLTLAASSIVSVQGSHASSILDALGSPARGQLAMRGTTSWGLLAAGFAGLPLVSAGPGADLVYAALSAIGGGTGQTSFTKGDILVATDLTTLVKLGAGSDDQLLTVDSGEASGLKWADPAGGSGVVNSGTATRAAYYPSTGAAVSGTPNLTFSATGEVGISPSARTSGVVPYLTLTAPTDTVLTAGTEAIGISFLGATRQHGFNTNITTQREFVIEAPTYSFVSATGTITNAATLAITGAPVVGTNAAITNPLSLWLQAGDMGFGASGSIAKISSTSGALTFTTAGSGIITLANDTTVSTNLKVGDNGNNNPRGLFFPRPTGNAIVGVYFDGLGSGVSKGSISYTLSVESLIICTGTGDMLFKTGAPPSLALTISASDNSLTLASTTDSSSASTGSLVTAGGMGIAKKLFVGDNIATAGTLTTAAPAGASANAWKLGSLVTGLTLTPDLTQALYVDVAGTVYKLVTAS